MTRNFESIRELASDTRFWQAATIALPVSLSVGVAFLLAVVGVAALFDPNSDPKPFLVVPSTIAILAVAAGCLYRRGTARSVGIALGIAVSAVFVGYGWAVAF